MWTCTVHRNGGDDSQPTQLPPAGNETQASTPAGNEPLAREGVESTFPAPAGSESDDAAGTTIRCDGLLCQKTLRTHQLRTALLCAEPQCEKRCHKQSACSGMTRYAVDKDLEWRCNEHGEADRARSDVPVQTATTAEISESGETDADTTKVKEYCGYKTCRARGAITAKHPVHCDGCKAAFHNKCTGLSREGVIVAAEKGGWTCKTCVQKQKQKNFSKQETTCKSEPKLRTRNSLRIVQWNCDGLNTKIKELEARLNEEKVDVCLLQETKLKESQTYTPHIEGYGSIRYDRAAAAGGGLFAFVKNDVIFESVSGEMRDATEAYTIRVKMGKNNWIPLVNVYIPPHNSVGQDVIRPAFEIIPTSSTSIICGDFNAHSQLWDSSSTEDERGNLVELWMISNELDHLNEKDEATHINRATSNTSSPDITLCGSKVRAKCGWRVMEAIGKSDHLPILITVEEPLSTQELQKTRAKWKRKDVNWEEFTEEVEKEIAATKEEHDLKKRVSRFHEILIRIGKLKVGKVKPGKRTKCYLTPTVRAAIQKRNRLRKQAKTRRLEWLAACDAAQEEIKKAKDECWEDLLKDVVNGEDETKLWRTIKSLNGTPSTNSPNEAMIHEGKTITTSREKANVFMNHYANISKLQLSKKERDLNRNLKKSLDAPTVGNESTSDFTMTELKTAIRKMRAKGAAGADDIPPSFLKALGPLACKSYLGSLTSHSEMLTSRKYGEMQS